MKKAKQILLILCAALLVAAVLPEQASAYENMAASSDAIELIKRYESFSPTPYQENGYWYVGYGVQIGKGEYSDGVTEAEAEALLRERLVPIESRLNRFFAENRLSPTQAQFDALADFTYTTGDGWLSGNSALLKLVSGRTTADRRETARVFGVWSHAGGKVQPGLAERRLEEAALYLDGSAESKEEFVFLAVEKQEGVICSTDFAVYECGEAYDAFPTMFRLGYTLSGVRTNSGEVLRLGDTADKSRCTAPVWEKNSYATAFDDVSPDSWYYDYVMELNENGVISGRGNGCFDPGAPVTAGEVLKLVLLAAGVEEQSPTDAHWASGYASYMAQLAPFSDGLLDALDEPVSRLDAARLAAVALGLGQSFADAPFADTDNGYVTALAEAGVVNGSKEQGELVFHPDSQLTRAEMSAIVWRLRCAAALGTTQTVRYGSRELDVIGGVPLNRYDPSGFAGDGKGKTYSEPGVTVLRGIDVARFQEEIDWETAKNDGIDFAILRVGGRFWGSGELYEDRLFETYYQGADEAGLRLGYYFFSQAITPAEAEEEADYVLEHLSGKRVDAPIVFDWETAGASDARTNGLPVQTVCDCAVAFCEKIAAAGYTPMVYMNTHDGYLKYDLSRLTDYQIWYAGQYNGAYPRFVYDFQMWQYTSSGEVDGVSGHVDMDLWFFR
ncbi:MAG: hypothetical protein E7425_00500 [Ruminococcaceae bacterium]|nr:hypothetical protein [Oscillospiraceae bacterium]